MTTYPASTALNNIDFTEYYSDYRKLQRLKMLVEFGNQKSRSNNNVADAYVELFNSILSGLQSIQNCVKIDSKTKSRAAGMQIALILEDTIFTSKNGYRRMPSKLSTLRNTVNHFRLSQYEAEVFFVYLKAVHHIAVCTAKQLEKFDEAICWLQKGAKLFIRFEEIYNGSDEKPFRLFDTSELYSNRNEMIPMENPIIQCEAIYLDILELLASLFNQLNDCVNYWQVIHDILYREQYLNCITPLGWTMKLLAVVPTLLKIGNFPQANYYLNIGDHIFKNNSFENELNDLQLLEIELAKTWFTYTLNILQYNKNRLTAQIEELATTNAESAKSTLPITTLKDDETNSKNKESQGSQFKLFENYKIDQFSPNNQLVSIMNYTEANALYAQCLPMVKCLLNSCDIQTLPIEFIKYNYQLFELYGLMAYFTHSKDEQFNYNKLRLDGLTQMIDKMNTICPHVITHIQKDVYKDLSEMQIDLLETNFKRIYDMNSNNPSGDGGGMDNKENIVIEAISALRCFNEKIV